MDDLWPEYLGTLNERLATCFAALRPRYRTAIVSTSFVGAREREQTTYGFEDTCDLVVYSHEEGLKKPDPRALRDPLSPTRRRAARGDLPRRHAGVRRRAQHGGMTAITFLDTDQAIAELDLQLGGPLGQ